MSHHPVQERRGNYSVLLILSLPALMGMGAIAVDLSYQKVVWAELQAAADIGAAAGGTFLDGTSEGVQTAVDRAIRAAERNFAGGRPVVIDPADVQTGYWDETTGDFVESDDPALIDSLQVTAWRGDVAASFAAVAFQDEETEAEGDSVALNPPPEPAGEVACYIPLAVPDCIFDKYTTEELWDHDLVLNPAGVDNVGWARVADSPNAAWLKDQIGDCIQDGHAAVGDQVGLQNGEVVSAVQEVKGAIIDSNTTWDTEKWGPIPARWSGSNLSASQYGRTWEGPLIVFDGGSEYCEGMGGGYNGYEEIVGFAWAVVFDVKTSGGAAEKNIRVRLDPMADQEIGLDGGGEIDGGVDYNAPVKIKR